MRKTTVKELNTNKSLSTAYRINYSKIPHTTSIISSAIRCWTEAVLPLNTYLWDTDMDMNVEVSDTDDPDPM